MQYGQRYWILSKSACVLLLRACSFDLGHFVPIREAVFLFHDSSSVHKERSKKKGFSEFGV